MTSLDTLRKTAKRWLAALQEGDADAHARLLRAYPSLRDRVTLRRVQHALARERGYENWMALIRAAENAARGDPLQTLLSAADHGDASAIAAILDRNPETLDQRGTLAGHTGLRTALHYGVHHEAVVRTLLERGASPNIRDEGDEAYPLHFAAERGELAIVRLLVEHGGDPIGAGTTHELDAIGWAVCFDNFYHPDVARYLHERGAPYSLFPAAALGERATIRDLAASGVDLNQRMDRTNHRRTAVHLAIVKGQPEALDALIDIGADINLEDAAGLTPLEQAALLANGTMTAQLVRAGAAMTLAAAIALDRPDEIARLVSAQPDAFSPANERRWIRLLIEASAHSSGRIVESLIQTVMRHRAGLSIVNIPVDEETAVDRTSGYTALHSAAFHGNDEAVQTLLRHGANPRLRDSKYCGAPTGWAAYAGHAAIANRIFDADVDIFEAIAFDRADRITDILDQDSGAISRPFSAYALCGAIDHEWKPAPDETPLKWAIRREKHDAVRVLTERGATTSSSAARASAVAFFLQSACWDHHTHGKGDHRMHDRAAQRLLALDPSIAHDSLYTAIVCGTIDDVVRRLDAEPGLVRERGGPRGWTPILYLTYTRFTHDATIANAVDIARVLLDRGANPNDFYMAGDARYSALAGVAGEGEQDSPRQPYAAVLFDLLIERGADPFDIQVLYNTHFSGDMLCWLDLVYAHTAGTPRASAWADPEWRMFDMGAYGSGARFLLETAVKKHDVPLAEWLLARGANPNAAPARDRRFPQRSLYELALMEGAPDIAELLVRHGAVRTDPSLDDRERFMRACFALNRDEAERQVRAHPEWRNTPDALFEAAARDRADVVELLLELGWLIDAHDDTGKTALHEAAANGSLRAARTLIDRGAAIDPHEATYSSAPIGWAAHGDRVEMVDLLSRYSREIWTLCFRGYVERVREVLAEEPERARVVSGAGHTPLWRLPDDDQKAMQIAELLFAAGADPRVTSANGDRAADFARRRGMREVADRLDAMAGPR